MLSVIIPSFNEEGNIPRTAKAVGEMLGKNKIEYELVFVNDGSSDGTWGAICREAQEDSHVVGLDLSRNFGKESAIFAGLEAAQGSCAVLFDCDMQFPPETLVEMYRIWEQGGVDIVEGKKNSRGKENFIYKGFSLLFYKLMGSSKDLDMRDASDFKLLDRTVIDALNRMPERLTFFRAMSSWVGFNTRQVYFDVADREIGDSKWKKSQLIRFAVNNITSFTSAPLQIVTICGVITFLVSVILGVNTLYNKFFGGSQEGFPTVIILQLLTSSVIMFSLGVIGYYLAKIYEEIKQRPRYIVRQTLRHKKGEEDIGKNDN